METTGQQSGSRRLQELDALRGIGALAVVLFHYTTRFHEMFPAAQHVPYGLIGGNYRVLLFFAISGFAIFFTLDRIGSAADFVMNRFSRLYPVYWIAIVLTVLVEYLGNVTALQIPPWAIVANFSMLEGFAFLPQVDGAYWTLTVEVAFYACMMALWLSPWRHRLEPVLIGWLACKWLYAAWPDMPERIIMLLILRYVPFFAIGMLSYRVWSGQRSWRQQWPYMAAVIVTIAALESRAYLIAALILVVAFAAMIAGRLRFLCVRPLLWLGSISYSLYLVHQHIGFVVMLKADELGIDPWVGCALAILIALSLAVGLNRLVERPAQRVIERWWRARSPRRAQSAAA
ncbi:acyltransferase [Sphingobium aquiterrae]|uniref:acyltransferase family protein n=1 Tax=Sphingobium aquiterrae TaxID=2038656 RepID=UPI00301A0664